MNKNVLSHKPATVWVPSGLDCQTIIDFLCQKFERYSLDIWQSRIERGLVKFKSGDCVTCESPYNGGAYHLLYYKEVEVETPIPFKEKIIFENDHIIVADKPHFLPVHPSGRYLQETLLTRLNKTYKDLAPAHRLDRLTAGLVILCKNKEERPLYQELFRTADIQKTYHAVAPMPQNDTKEWHIRNRIKADDNTWFLMQNSEGQVNAESNINLLQDNGQFGLFQLKPKTGKKHQLRLHMCLIGCPILHDPFYPELLPEDKEDHFNEPLMLLAKELQFKDPITQEKMHFCSRQHLELP